MPLRRPPAFEISAPLASVQLGETPNPLSSQTGGRSPQVQFSPVDNQHELRISILSDHSFDSTMIGSVEEAIIATAVRHITITSQPSFIPPKSAPPRIEAFAVPSQSAPAHSTQTQSTPAQWSGGHILPSQVELAEQLEKEIAERLPIPGPVVRPADHNKKLRVLIYDDDNDQPDLPDSRTPASILGSDIIYRSPTQMNVSAGDNRVSSNGRRSTFGVLAVEVPEHESYITNQEILSEYHSDRHSFSITSHRTSGVGSLRSTRHSTRHFSVTSHRMKSMEELPSVPEQGNTFAPSTPSSMRKSRRTTFGRPVSSSSRRTYASFTPQEPVPPMPSRPSVFLSPLSIPRLTFDSLSPIEPLRVNKHSPSHLRPPIPPFSVESELGQPVPSTSAVDSPDEPIAGPSSQKLQRPLPSAPIPDNVGGSLDGLPESPDLLNVDRK